MHPKNKTRYKTLDKLAADPRVKEVWSEEYAGDGIWASLVPGYNLDGCSCVHEWSAGDLVRSFGLVTTGATY